MTHVSLGLHIGRRLRTRRRLLDLSQAELGRRCGVSFQQIHKYETALVSISAARLFSLAEALGVTSAYFFDGYRADGVAADVERTSPYP